MINKTEKRINYLYANLLNDIDFDWLELESGLPNIFDILGITNNELKHSNMLSWLLQPSQAHGINESFIKRFLREIAQDEKSEISQLQTENLPFEDVEIRREWNHIDLLIIFPEHAIAIENKIWSKESGRQLERYRKLIEEFFPDKSKSYVYLTPNGHTPNLESNYYINISYQSVVDILKRILKIKSKELTSRMLVLLEDYLQILQRRIMENDKSVELARKIYNNHKELFDFVYEYIPDLSETLRPYFEKKVLESDWLLGSANKGVVRFQTKEMAELIPPYKKANGWPKKEPILFEIDYWWNSKNDNSDARIYFKMTISNGENDELRAALKNTIESIDGAKTPAGKKWLVYFPFKKKINWTEIEEEESAILSYVEDVWPKITATVHKINNAIIENAKTIKRTFNE